MQEDTLVLVSTDPYYRCRLLPRLSWTPFLPLVKTILPDTGGFGSISSLRL